MVKTSKMIDRIGIESVVGSIVMTASVCELAGRGVDRGNMASMPLSFDDQGKALFQSH